MKFGTIEATTISSEEDIDLSVLDFSETKRHPRGTSRIGATATKKPHRVTPRRGFGIMERETGFAASEAGQALATASPRTGDPQLRRISRGLGVTCTYVSSLLQGPIRPLEITPNGVANERAGPRADTKLKRPF